VFNKPFCPRNEVRNGLHILRGVAAETARSHIPGNVAPRTVDAVEAGVQDFHFEDGAAVRRWRSAVNTRFLAQFDVEVGRDRPSQFPVFGSVFLVLPQITQRGESFLFWG